MDQRHVDVSTAGAVGGCQESGQGGGTVDFSSHDRRGMWIDQMAMTLETIDVVN